LAGPSFEEQTETRILIEEALSLLKPIDAACLQLRYENGFTYEQIGRMVSNPGGGA
jgi:DNA-directed RNA polymerase specialized sigma24 family protein